MFLSYQCRMSKDQRSFGDLFYACCQEIQYISLMQALLRILSRAAEMLRQLSIHCEEVFEDFYPAVLHVAIKYLGPSKNRSIVFSMNTES